MAARAAASRCRVRHSRSLVCRSTWIAITKELRPTFYSASMVWPTQYVLFSNRSWSKGNRDEKSSWNFSRRESAVARICYRGDGPTADGRRCNQAAESYAGTGRRAAAARRECLVYGFGELRRGEREGRSVFGGFHHRGRANACGRQSHYQSQHGFAFSRQRRPHAPRADVERTGHLRWR